MYLILPIFASIFSLLLAENANVTQDGPKKLNAKVGAYVVFNCTIDFPQNIIIPHVLEWRKDNEPIYSWVNGESSLDKNFVNRINLLSGSDAWRQGEASINVTNIRETDEGWYECKVIFPNRTPASKPNGTWFHLSVEGGNLLRTPPVNETVTEGASVTLQCESKIATSVVTWYKDDIPISNLTELRNRMRILPEGSLEIVSAGMADSGYYSCEISNDEGRKQSAGAYLNVQFKAKIVYAPKKVYLPYGKTGRLHCYYRANPEVNKIRWEKDGFLFDAYNVPGVFSRKNGSLYFSKVNESSELCNHVAIFREPSPFYLHRSAHKQVHCISSSDESVHGRKSSVRGRKFFIEGVEMCEIVDDSHDGEYTCTPYNELGTDGPSPRMRVVVQRAPVFTVTPHVLYLKKIGETVRMHCDAIDGDGGEGVEKPTITWSKKYGEIPANRSIVVGGNLTITDIQLADRGTYSCVATNEAATITSEAELMVEEKLVASQAPYNVTANVSDNSVTVRWLSGHTRPTMKFSVWYRSDNSQEWRMIELNNNIYEARIADLNPGQTYDVMVLSQNADGDGMFSKTLKITTKKFVESTAVTDEDEEITEEVDREFRSPIGLYQQIGPPTDVFVQMTDNGHRVVWKPPKHGHEMLKYYTVVWYRDWTEERVGFVQTLFNNFTITNLEERRIYRIQIFAMSTNDYETSSQKYIYWVPTFSAEKYLLIGALGGVVFTAVITIVTRCVLKM